MAACACAVALACTLGASAAHAELLPEGSGEFDVSVLTDVLPSVDPAAQLADVIIHVANDAGEHVEAAQVQVEVVPPNATSSAVAASSRGVALAVEAPAQATHATSASGTTSRDGRVLLPSAAVGATYRVSVVKDGHESSQAEFTCTGASNETWELVLKRIPNPLPPGGSSPTGDGDVSGEVQGLPGAGVSSAGGAAAAVSSAGDAVAASAGDASSISTGTSEILPKPLIGFIQLLSDTFPWWLIVLAVLVVALTAGCWWQANRIRKEEGSRES